ncbi:unnamed protein product [Paramecium primaurelia]|uniref:Uncharacterized protein n=1 Tax=Paramecium primaurelia TaxID=5886 RepID=A0A8S1PY04_PARPR|nr:unnamed protein product [Paramecium primaurelia]
MIPKMIEQINDLNCANNHNLQPYMVVFDPKLSQKDRILCTKCMEDFDSITKMVTFKKAQQLIEENQARLLELLENIIQPNIKQIDQLQKHLYSLKSYFNQELDQLIENTKEWINNFDQIKQIHRDYSFFQELDILISNEKIQDINESQFNNQIIKINQALCVKMKLKLEQFKNFNDYNQCTQILNNIINIVQVTSVTDFEETEINNQTTNITEISTIQQEESNEIDQSELKEIQYYVYEDLQNFVNLLYSLIAVKEHFKENPSHPMIVICRNKIILQLNISNSIHTDLINQYKNTLKQILQKEKQNAKKIINQFKLLLGDEYQLHIDNYISNSLNDELSMKSLSIEKLDIQTSPDQNQNIYSFPLGIDNQKIFSHWMKSKTYNSKTFDSFIFKAISYKQITEIKIMANFTLSSLKSNKK